MITEKNSKIIIRTFAVTEILIGLYISISFITASLISPPGRPITIYVLIVLASLISVIIGVGLFRYKNLGRQFLIFFAGYVIFTKFLLFSSLVEFTVNTVNFMSVASKDTVSFIYHCCILIIFNLKDIKKALN